MSDWQTSVDGVEYLTTLSKGIAGRHWAPRAGTVTLCGQPTRTGRVDRFPDCVVCKAAMHALDDDVRRRGYAELVNRWGFQVGGRRHAVATAGGTAHHLLGLGDVSTRCGVQYPRVVESLDVSPDCRRCWRSADSDLQSTPANERLELIASLAADVIVEHVQVDIVNVPGDQVERLRRAIRATMRRRKLRVSTWHRDSLVVARSQDVYDRNADARGREVVETFSALLTSDSQRVLKSAAERQLNWATWAS